MRDEPIIVAQGSVYSVRVEQISDAKVLLMNENGVGLIVHTDDIPEIIRVLRMISEGE